MRPFLRVILHDITFKGFTMFKKFNAIVKRGNDIEVIYITALNMATALQSLARRERCPVESIIKVIEIK